PTPRPPNLTDVTRRLPGSPMPVPNSPVPGLDFGTLAQAFADAGAPMTGAAMSEKPAARVGDAPLPIEQQLYALEHAVPAFLAGAISCHGLTTKGYKAYLDELLKSAQDPDDRMERMLIRQMALAHLAGGNLQALAGAAKTAQVTAIYAAIGCRLL